MAGGTLSFRITVDWVQGQPRDGEQVGSTTRPVSLSLMLVPPTQLAAAAGATGAAAAVAAAAGSGVTGIAPSPLTNSADPLLSAVHHHDGSGSASGTNGGGGSSGGGLQARELALFEMNIFSTKTPMQPQSSRGEVAVSKAALYERVAPPSASASSAAAKASASASAEGKWTDMYHNCVMKHNSRLPALYKCDGISFRWDHTGESKYPLIWAPKKTIDHSYFKVVSGQSYFLSFALSPEAVPTIQHYVNHGWTFLMYLLVKKTQNSSDVVVKRMLFTTFTVGWSEAASEHRRRPSSSASAAASSGADRHKAGTGKGATASGAANGAGSAQPLSSAQQQQLAAHQAQQQQQQQQQLMQLFSQFPPNALAGLFAAATSSSSAAGGSAPAAGALNFGALQALLAAASASSSAASANALGFPALHTPSVNPLAITATGAVAPATALLQPPQVPGVSFFAAAPPTASSFASATSHPMHTAVGSGALSSSTSSALAASMPAYPLPNQQGISRPGSSFPMFQTPPGAQMFTANAAGGSGAGWSQAAATSGVHSASATPRHSGTAMVTSTTSMSGPSAPPPPSSSPFMQFPPLPNAGGSSANGSAGGSLPPHPMGLTSSLSSYNLAAAAASSSSWSGGPPLSAPLPMALVGGAFPAVTLKHEELERGSEREFHDFLAADDGGSSSAADTQTMPASGEGGPSGAKSPMSVAATDGSVAPILPALPIINVEMTAAPALPASTATAAATHGHAMLSSTSSAVPGAGAGAGGMADMSVDTNTTVTSPSTVITSPPPFSMTGGKPPLVPHHHLRVPIPSITQQQQQQATGLLSPNSQPSSATSSPSQRAASNTPIVATLTADQAGAAAAGTSAAVVLNPAAPMTFVNSVTSTAANTSSRKRAHPSNQQLLLQQQLQQSAGGLPSGLPALSSRRSATSSTSSQASSYGDEPPAATATAATTAAGPVISATASTVTSDKKSPVTPQSPAMMPSSGAASGAAAAQGSSSGGGGGHQSKKNRASPSAGSASGSSTGGHSQRRGSQSLHGNPNKKGRNEPARTVALMPKSWNVHDTKTDRKITLVVMPPGLPLPNCTVQFGGRTLSASEFSCSSTPHADFIVFGFEPAAPIPAAAPSMTKMLKKAIVPVSLWVGSDCIWQDSFEYVFRAKRAKGVLDVASTDGNTDESDDEDDDSSGMSGKRRGGYRDGKDQPPNKSVQVVTEFPDLRGFLDSLQHGFQMMLQTYLNGEYEGYTSQHARQELMRAILAKDRRIFVHAAMTAASHSALHHSTVNQLDTYGFALLHYVVALNFLDLVELLVRSAHPLDINIVGFEGLTPMDFAYQRQTIDRAAAAIPVAAGAATASATTSAGVGTAAASPTLGISPLSGTNSISPASPIPSATATAASAAPVVGPTSPAAPPINTALPVTSGIHTATHTPSASVTRRPTDSETRAPVEHGPMVDLLLQAGARRSSSINRLAAARSSGLVPAAVITGTITPSRSGGPPVLRSASFSANHRRDSRSVSVPAQQLQAVTGSGAGAGRAAAAALPPPETPSPSMNGRRTAGRDAASDPRIAASSSGAAGAAPSDGRSTGPNLLFCPNTVAALDSKQATLGMAMVAPSRSASASVAADAGDDDEYEDDDYPDDNNAAAATAGGASRPAMAVVAGDYEYHKSDGAGDETPRAIPPADADITRRRNVQPQQLQPQQTQQAVVLKPQPPPHPPPSAYGTVADRKTPTPVLRQSGESNTSDDDDARTPAQDAMQCDARTFQILGISVSLLINLLFAYVLPDASYQLRFFLFLELLVTLQLGILQFSLKAHRFRFTAEIALYLLYTCGTFTEFVINLSSYDNPVEEGAYAMMGVVTVVQSMLLTTIICHEQLESTHVRTVSFVSGFMIVFNLMRGASDIINRFQVGINAAPLSTVLMASLFAFRLQSPLVWLRIMRCTTIESRVVTSTPTGTCACVPVTTSNSGGAPATAIATAEPETERVMLITLVRPIHSKRHSLNGKPGDATPSLKHERGGSLELVPVGSAALTVATAKPGSASSAVALSSITIEPVRSVAGVTAEPNALSVSPANANAAVDDKANVIARAWHWIQVVMNWVPVPSVAWPKAEYDRAAPLREMRRAKYFISGIGAGIVMMFPTIAFLVQGDDATSKVVLLPMEVFCSASMLFVFAATHVRKYTSGWSLTTRNFEMSLLYALFAMGAFADDILRAWTMEKPDGDDSYAETAGDAWLGVTFCFSAMTVLLQTLLLIHLRHARRSKIELFGASCFRFLSTFMIMFNAVWTAQILAYASSQESLILLVISAIDLAYRLQSVVFWSRLATSTIDCADGSGRLLVLPHSD